MSNFYVSRGQYNEVLLSTSLPDNSSFMVDLDKGDLQVHSKAELMGFTGIGRYLVLIKFKDHNTLIAALEEALNDARRMK